MEQKFGASGLRNLDPMYFWKYVMAKKREHPCVVIYNYKPEKLLIWAKEHPRVNFIVESDKVPGGIDVFIHNTVYRWMEGMSYDEWLRRWNWTDYVLCDENDKEYWIQAQLCGVTPLFRDKDLEKVLNDIQPLDSVQRIDNWEQARNYLDTLR